MANSDMRFTENQLFWICEAIRQLTRWRSEGITPVGALEFKIDEKRVSIVDTGYEFALEV